jgi:hypothetical protein
MNRIASTLLCALALAAPATLGAADEADAKAMQQMMELMKPGKEHAQLGKMVGTWDATVTAWMKPGAPPSVTKGVAIYTPVYDGRFVRADFSGDMMGQPFTGIGIDGFDRARGVYTASWMDSMSTSMMFETGTSKDDGKTIEYSGEIGDCMAPGKTVKIRSIVSHTGDDAMTYTMYQTRDGKEAKSLEIAYTRRHGGTQSGGQPSR